MSHQVLARKWRPRTFQQMVGQEPILRMLTNALAHQRIHHAYLFTGTRGVGKTTLARLLAKCLNCETGISANPCGTCSICTSIDAGKFLDLIEIDAASRTKVEDTREILDNVQYAPTQGRYKIYLIDEVHMLSGHSFNALLKTLEEPPAHVKFLLATTDPKRLPVTILSRCLQFNLKRVPTEQITKHLHHICESEKIIFEKPALDLLAKAADGSLRDALSLLDQAIAFCGEKVSANETREMLGSIEQDAIYRLLETLATQNGKNLLTEIASLAEHAPDFNQILEALLSALHQINIAQLVPEITQEETIQHFAKKFSAEEVQLFYQIALIGRKDLPYAPSPQQGFEMVMLRMLAFQPSAADSTTLKTEKPISLPKKSENKIDPLPQKIATEVKSVMTEIPPVLTVTPPLITQNWSEILSKLQLTGLANALASNCTLIQFSNNKLELALAPQHEPMLNKKLLDRIEESLTKHFNRPIKLEIKIIEEDFQTPAKQKTQEKAEKQIAAQVSIQNDTHVKKMLEMFDATLDINTIKALDK